MKFKNIFKDTEENLRLALLSLWAPGSHPLRPYLNELFDREPLIQEPVFESTFGWETVQNEDWRNFLNAQVIEKLEIGKKYDPYTHQTESWKQLASGKSIVVTSGTGSGKTECFMYPVMSDLYENKGGNAIKAIFLYPLNALMEDQKKRLNNYCEATGLKFAVYNGATGEYKAKGEVMSNEVATRDEIRDKKNEGKRPQILLTNPSMLEYVLVRQDDQEMLKQSKGKLRWIVIDEAHTYSGSAAVELAYQIKRILDAFKVEPNNVRFACTSATISGAAGAQSLLDFISTVIGQDKEKIVEIGGNRLVPTINEEVLTKKLESEGLQGLSANKLLAFRKHINEVPGMTLNDIWSTLCPEESYEPLKALELVDKLCEIKIDDVPLLSLRAHFFMRAISGLYACGYDKCKGAQNGSLYGYLTTYKSSVCPDCGNPLLEVLQCKRCSSFMLMGDANDQTGVVSQCIEGDNHEDYFALADDIDEENGDGEDRYRGNSNTFFALPYTQQKYHKPLKDAHERVFNFTRIGCHSLLKEKHVMGEVANLISSGRTELMQSKPWVNLCKDKGEPVCPNCGKLIKGKRMHANYMRIPVNFINQVIAPVLLEESRQSNNTWGKYIAFTDSRQGTAISAKTFNIDVERRVARSETVKELAKDENPMPPEIQENWNTLTEEFKKIAKEIYQIKPKELSLFELAKIIYDESIFLHLLGDLLPTDNRREAYKHALIRNFIGQRQTYTQSVENIGLLTITYPALKKAKAPNALTDLNENIKDSDWQDFLKIILDYYMRLGNHIQPLIDDERKFVRDATLGTPIFEDNWPQVKDQKASALSRIILLLCAGVGINSIEQLRKKKEIINNILKAAFHTLVDLHLLRQVSDENKGYNDSRYFPDHQYINAWYLDLSPEEENLVAKIRRTPKAWVCPVTRRMVDTIFCGFSPNMTGELSQDTFDAYHCSEPVNLPDFTKPADEVKASLPEGQWTDRHCYLNISGRPYLAAEHSAQQSRELLQEYVKEFASEHPTINVLHCSTTMEMGVDIGDIDIVLMDTVPPTPANYKQRVGRAGRMGQTKSIGFSMCNNTPVGQYAFAHPMWALETMTSMRPVRESDIIRQRHYNSYFFRWFVSEQCKGIQVTTTNKNYFDGAKSTCDFYIDYLQRMSMNPDFESHFKSVFGPLAPFDRAIREAETEIKGIQAHYKDVMKELDEFHEKYKDDERRALAIANQQRKFQEANLLTFLSENQYLPNASMPTGVVSFEFRDKDQSYRLNDLFKKLAQVRDKISAEEDGTEKTLLKKKANDLSVEIQKLIRQTESSRDSRMALNEYAPEQTVVVNEKNYVSAGVKFFGAYNDKTQTRAIYFCENCGKVEYLPTIDENKTCGCGGKYRGILRNHNERFTLAYEPVGFRTDQNRDGSREENTRKRYYEINPVLLKADWNHSVKVNLCDATSSGEQAEILFYNAGNGNGFAMCKCCGRTIVEPLIPTSGMPKQFRGHNRLEISKRSSNVCEAGESDIAHNVVFTARHQTCYTVLRFKNAPDSIGYIKDITTVYSLGVILRRALVEFLGIDESEVDLGYRETNHATELFIYDTARGGCGYSLHLAKPDELNQIFAIALQMLNDFDCHCEEDGGACSRCLIDRSNYRYTSWLSKGKAMEWLSMQQKAQSSVPDEIKAISPNARVSYESMKSVLKDLSLGNDEVKCITLFATDNTDGFAPNDWISVHSEMGKVIRRCVESGISVDVMLEYHPEAHTKYEDLYPFATLNIPDATVKFVKDMGKIKTLMKVEYAEGRVGRYFSLSPSVLTMSNDWGNDMAYVDEQDVNVSEQNRPKLTRPDGITVRYGQVNPPTQVAVKDYFKKIILPATLKNGDIEKLQSVLQGEIVDIRFSDPYVKSALASLMLVHLIKELRDLFGFQISSFDLQINTERRKSSTNRFSSYTSLSADWPTVEEADEYTLNLIYEELDIETKVSSTFAQHHRFIRLTNRHGKSVEIRFDHGVAGGWKTNRNYGDVDIVDGNLKVSTIDHELLYYVIIRD